MTTCTISWACVIGQQDVFSVNWCNIVHYYLVAQNNHSSTWLSTCWALPMKQYGQIIKVYHWQIHSVGQNRSKWTSLWFIIILIAHLLFISYNNIKVMFPRYSENTTSLLAGLLTYNPKTRLTVKRALAHPYFSESPRRKSRQRSPLPFVLQVLTWNI